MAEIRIDVVTTDNASQGIAKIDNELGSFQQGLSKIEKAIAGTRTTIGGLDTDIMLFGKNVGSTSDLLHGLGISLPTTPMALFGQGLKVAIGFGKESINVFANTAKQVRQLMTEIGGTSEEASKLIEVADDMGVSFGELTTAMRGAIRKGVEPTVSGLGNLSDAYLLLQPGVERTKFLMDNFGRSGAEIARLMELGSDKINQMGDALEGTARIMDEKALAAAEDYRLAMDELNDSATDLKITIGTALAPAVSDFAKLFADMLKLEGDTWFEDGSMASRRFIMSMFEGRDIIENYVEVTKDEKAAIEAATVAQAAATIATWASVQANRYHIDTIRAGTTAVERDAAAKKLNTMATYELQKQLMQLRNETLLATALAGDYQDILNEQTTTTADLAAEHAELTAELLKLQEQGYKPTSEKVQELNTALLENEAAQLAAEDATRKATAQFIYQKVAASLDATAALGLANAMGLVSDADFDLMTKIQELTTRFDLNRDGMINAAEAAGGYTTAVLALYAAAELAAGVYEIIFNVSVRGDQIPDTGVDEDDEIFDRPEEEEEEDYDPDDPDAPRALGGPVTSGVPYLVGERGPEVFIPNTSGTIVPNDQLSGVNIQNMYIYANDYAGGQAAAEAILRVVGKGRKLQAAAGMRYMGTG